MGTVDMRCTLVVCVNVCARAKWLYSLDADRSFCSDFGLRGLRAAGYSFCKDVHADSHCDPKDARLAVRSGLCTTDADCFFVFV